MRGNRYLLACLTVGTAWFLVEVGFGLAFLAAGVRLWRYEICPVLWAITSPLAWPLAGLLILPLSWAFDVCCANRCRGVPKFLARLAFVMIAGPLLEVPINDIVFRGLFGQPMYEYLVLPTFGGSGSLLSPIYYSTVLIHLPLTDRLASSARARTAGSGPARCGPGLSSGPA